MSALTAEPRERLRERFLATYDGIPDEWHAGPATVAEFRALLADSDALAAAERERDEAVRLIGTCAGCGKHTVTVWVCQACYIAMQEESAALRAQVATLREALERECECTCQREYARMDDGHEEVREELCLRCRALASTAPEREGADEHAR